MPDSIRIKILSNPIRNYAWGSKTAIASLLGTSNITNTPQAELWMGAHPSASSMITREDEVVPLVDLIAEDPEGILGPDVAFEFRKRLPFLLKILAAAEPLSIQVHPNMRQAVEGFQRENKSRIALDAFNRSYKDANHKPEIICALTTFHALLGFRKIETLLAMLDEMEIRELDDEIKAFELSPNTEGLKAFFSALVSLPPKRKNAMLAESVFFCKNNPELNPAYGWVLKLSEKYPEDVGILSPVLLNYVQLSPGQALFLPAGEMHAYLEGVGVELMANSDNVLRGGLTPKFVDTEELLKVLTFQDGEPQILSPETVLSERFYDTPVNEFRLSEIQVTDKKVYEKKNNRSIEILVCVDGRAGIEDLAVGTSTPMHQGFAILIPARVAHYRIQGDAKIYKASVPV